MSSLWFLVAMVPLGIAAGWCGRGSKPDRWFTVALYVMTAYSAVRLLWEHEYVHMLLVAGGPLGLLLWHSLQHQPGDDERGHEPGGGGERGDGDGYADASPYCPRPFK